MSMHRVVNAHDRDYDQQCCGSSRDYKRLVSGPARSPMNKRLLKRHKRQVSRAKAGTRLSEPDVRTPEQVRAAREASRAATARRTGAHTRYSTPPTQRQAEIAARVQPAAEGGVSAASHPDGAAKRDGSDAAGPE